MKMRKSMLNGRLENEVEDFVETLENEFDYNVESVSFTYNDSDTGEKIVHVFNICSKESSFYEI